jgi:hypothetical protein
VTKIFKRKLVKKDSINREWLTVEIDPEEAKDIEIKQVIWRDFSNDHTKQPDKK